jgi:surface protein
MAVGTFKLPIVAGSSNTPSWTRPTDWLTIPTPGTQEVIGLMAVYDDGANYVALQCTGAYTVDWGDGTTTNYASNSVASYQHTFSSLSAGTLTTEGFRQALVRITPQAGQNLTLVSFGVQNATLGKGFAPGWLEFDIRTPNCLPTWAGSSNVIRYARLEKITIRQMSTTNPTNLFNNLYSLKSVYIEPTETTGITLFNSMFINCYALEEVNAFDTSSATNVSSMFDSCYNLQIAPLLNCSASTNALGMFQNCYSLKTVPAITMGTDASQMFFNCTSLETVGLINTTTVTNFTSMFNACRSLTTIPLLVTSSGSNFSNMFSGCNSLTEIPLLNTASATTMVGMFNSCNSLMYLPALNTSNVTTVNQMFNNCYNLRELPALSLPVCTVFTSWLANNTTLSKSNVVNPTRGHSYSGMSLSQANIVTIFTNLGIASGAQTITVSSNPGYAGLTAGERLIATAKGWTIA